MISSNGNSIIAYLLCMTNKHLNINDNEKNIEKLLEHVNLKFYTFIISTARAKAQMQMKRT